MSSNGKQNKDKGWPHFVAGGVAGCSAVLLLHPFDVVKTRLQVQDGLQGQLPVYRGTADAMKTILRTEGWRGLYAGLSPSLLGSTVSWGAYLYMYERIKSWHRDRQGIAAEGGDRLRAAWNLLSAAQAGAMVCCLTNPIWLIKTRLALQQRTTQLAAAGTTAAAAAAAVSRGSGYKGIIDAFIQIGKNEGIKGYYKGFGPSLILQTAHGAIQFAAYEELKHLAARAGRNPGSPNRELSSAEVSAYGAVSKFLAAITTYPTQVIRSRLQQRFEGRSVVYSSSWQAVALTWQREGLVGFYKGLVPSLMRVMPQSAITLMVYEGLVKALENRPDESQGEQRQQLARLVQQQEEAREQERQQHRRQHRQRTLTDRMAPLVVGSDSIAEQ